MIDRDYHIHTAYSNDSTQDMEESVKSAIALGLREIAFTDHYEHDVETFDYEGDYWLDRPAYIAGVLRMREKYARDIRILLGVEIGAQPGLADYFAGELANDPWDFIIASCHTIDRIDLFFGKVQEGKTKDEMQDLYFRNLLELVSGYDCFSVFGHLDYVTRYGGERFRGLNYERQRDVIDEILKMLIAKGKGIEINTSAFRYNEGRFYPHPDIVRRYFELGGEILTVGSDAHKCGDIARDFDKVADFLRSVGKPYITVYEGMKPRFVKI
ncbi:MAG: histidinol-phosphatase HisJ family protein [Fusobacteriaceae bacterium]|jgi:histidinol-phosphatase (PHP family)|nr:histidinol-phosphatase HisJ family protein [Fusobacteriaceae bacterium]